MVELGDASVDAIILNLPRSKSGNASQKNFAILLDSGFDASDTICFASEEMRSMNAHSTGHRCGTASGVHQIGQKCLRFTSVTQKDTTLYFASNEDSVYVKARYYNHSGQLKTCNQGYSAMAMNRLNKHQKLDQAKK